MMMKKKNLLINLPEDVFITNILLSTVLPIKSLLSLRCVCKYLRNLITSPAFIKMQLHHSTTTNQVLNNNNPLVLIKGTQRPNAFFSLKFNGGDPCRPDEVVEFVSPIECSNIWGSCNGLVCLAKRDNVCLWNPFTKEYKVLPPPLPSSLILEFPIGNVAATMGLITYGFGYDRLLDDYKIIRCSPHLVVLSNDYSYHIPYIEFQVYALGTNTWRKISTDNNPYKSYFVLSELMANKPIVFVNGALVWIMSTTDWWKSSERTEPKIVSFDIEKEVFREIQKPSMAKFIPDLSFWVTLEVLRGCLCVLENDSSTKTLCNVWMMMDYGVKESWTKLFTILRTEVPNYHPVCPTSYRLIRFCENSTEILMGSYNVIVVYDMINNKARRVEFGEEIGKSMYQSEIYIESLVSLNSGVYKGEKRIRSKRRRNRSKKKKKRVSKLVRDIGNINLD